MSLNAQRTQHRRQRGPYFEIVLRLTSAIGYLLAVESSDTDSKVFDVVLPFLSSVVMLLVACVARLLYQSGLDSGITCEGPTRHPRCIA